MDGPQPVRYVLAGSNATGDCIRQMLNEEGYRDWKRLFGPCSHAEACERLAPYLDTLGAPPGRRLQ